MNAQGRHYRTIWPNADGRSVDLIDQRWLPHEFRVETIRSVDAMATAIRDMWVRGAPLIGIAAAYGLALQGEVDPSDVSLARAALSLQATRPTAVNLRWAVEEMLAVLRPAPVGDRTVLAWQRAAELADADIAVSEAIGRHGCALLEAIAQTKKPGERVNILTHCNAGWLATVDYGTATAPIYLAAARQIPLHVYVDETRPRNQGAQLTAWELGEEGIPHTLIVDNAGGHLMQQGAIDLVIVGTDRTAANGDLCNKIGTYLKALAAFDNRVPFFVALPSSTIDWTLADGRSIPIEQRSGDEVSYVWGRRDDGETTRVRNSPAATPAANYAFDVTPARLVTGLITERGICAASPAGLRALFPERG